jgi:chromosome segregation ATPase
VVGVGKQPRSFSIDQDVADMLAERDDLNASAVVNKFLREYVAGGRGEEAALEIRLNELDDEIADLEKELEQKRRERERIESQLDSRRSELREQLTEVEQKVRAGEFPRENVDADNPAIQNWASKAGVPAERFANELQARL